MFDTAMEEMEHLIPSFDRHTMTSRQKLLTCSFVKELYDHREEYQKEERRLTNAVSSMLLKENIRRRGHMTGRIKVIRKNNGGRKRQEAAGIIAVL